MGIGGTRKVAQRGSHTRPARVVREDGAGGVGGWGGRLERAGEYALLSMLLGVVDVGELEFGSFTTWAFRQLLLFLVVPSGRLWMQHFSWWGAFTSRAFQ